MSLSVIKLDHLVVYDANLMANDYLHQSIALTTFAGFTHLIERWFTEQGCQIEFAATAVMPIIHQVSKPVGFPRSSTYNYASSNKAAAPRMLSQYEGKVVFSVLLAFQYRRNPERVPHRWLENRENRTEFLHFLNQHHFAGGQFNIIQANQVKTVGNESDEIDNAIQKLTADGYILEDCQSLLTDDRVADAHDQLDQLVHLIVRKKGQGANPQGYLMPAAIGFKLLEEPVANRLQRHPDQECLHAFAEPMLSMIRLRSIGSFKKQYRSDPIPAWWEYQDIDNCLFVRGITTEELIQF